MGFLKLDNVRQVAHDKNHIATLGFRLLLPHNLSIMRRNVLSKIIGMLFGPIFLLSGCGTNRERIFPQKTTLTESVYSSVTVQPDSMYQAFATVAGIVDKNLVNEGDTVIKGAPLVQLVNTTPKLNTQNAGLALQLAQENYAGTSAILKGIEDEIASAELKFKNDSLNYFRQRRLWSQGIGSKAEYDNRKLAYELSSNNLSLLELQYARTKNELETQVEQARNTYEAAQVTTGDFTVTSKIHGKVYAVLKNQGEIVTTLEPLALVGSTNDFVIEMLVDEVDIVKIGIGQKTLITLEAYKNEVFEATVSKIYPRKDERSQTFKVEAVFDNPPRTLYPGLAGEGNIIIDKREDVLTIPKVFLVNGNEVETEQGQVKVELGLENLDRVEIIEGLDSNTEILMPRE